MQNYRDNIMQYRANRQMAPCCEKNDALEGMPLAMAYVPWQMWRKLYDAEKGFSIRVTRMRLRIFRNTAGCEMRR